MAVANLVIAGPDLIKSRHFHQVRLVIKPRIDSVGLKFMSHNAVYFDL
jgi:hypothetical protein